MPEMEPAVTIQRSAERYLSVREGIETRHCFSFGDHYDPDNIGFGDLTAVNDEALAPGSGYDLHRHRDAEIVTWVLDGTLEHEDSAGHHGTIRPGTIQRMSAGAGVEHAERNASADDSLRFVQMWLRSDGVDRPSYRQADLEAHLDEPEFVLAVAGGHDETAAIDIDRVGAELWIGRIAGGVDVALPDAPLRHLHVVRGGVAIDGEQLADGDTMRIAAPGAHRIIAEGATEVLLWAMHRSS
ncbi:pirin family protein [Solicola gregarius]|uniref:Pirin family protein n=1 Tax=Solicola gregarius TaxID=2908642 RepID=A0AA46YJJ8_9ACTN|nr:pirin family protein [Solicola gregarius]UYM03566.1 pirin family protein [Solicola gregarius]